MATVGEIKDRLKRTTRDTGAFAKAIFAVPTQSLINYGRGGLVVAKSAVQAAGKKTFREALAENAARIPTSRIGERALGGMVQRGLITPKAAQGVQTVSDIGAGFVAPGISRIGMLDKAPALSRLAGYTALRSGQGAVGGFVSEAGRTGDLEQAQRAARTGALFGAAGNIITSPRLTIKAGQEFARRSVSEPSRLGMTLGSLGKDAEEVPTIAKNLQKRAESSLAYAQSAKRGELEDLRLQPGEKIKIFRAGSGKPGSGEFVTTSKENAMRYLADRPGTRLSSITVDSGDLIRGNGLQNEFVYAPRGKERGFITSAKTAKNLSQEVKSQVKGYYSAKANKDLLEQAVKDLEKNPLEVYVDNALNAKELTDKTVAQSIVAAQMLNQRGDYEKATEIIIKNAERLTEAGRAVQAATLLDKLTPEGIQTFAAREMSKVGKKLTPQDSEYLAGLSKSIRDLPEGRDRNLAIQKMFEYVSDMTPSPMIERATALWKAGLLTGFKTSGTNILANTGHAVLEKAKDPVAVMVDSVVSLFTGKRTKTATLSGLGKGAVKGGKEAVDYLTTGYDPKLIGSKVREGNRVNFGSSKIGKATQKYVEGIFRFIGAQDRPFYQSRFQNSLFDQAGAEAINRGLSGAEADDFVKAFVASPPEQASMQAAIDAEISTFQNRTQLGEAASKLQKAGGGLGTLVVPFGKTPSAVATQIVNYSPVGIAKTIVENIGKGKFNQRAFSEGLGRGLTGTAILAIGYKLAEKGMVNTSYPRTETERALWEAENRKANTIITNDGNQITAQALGPAGNALLLGAYVYQATKNAENPVMAGVAGLGNTLTESTFLSGLSTSIDAVKDPLREGPKFLQKTVGSAIPTLVADVSRATDLNEQGKPITREVSTVKDALINRTPFRRNLIESKDILGRGRISGESAAGIMFNPLRTATLNRDDQTAELRRLVDTGELTLSRIDKSQTIGGQKVSLTPQQQDALETAVSPQVNEAITALIANPLYAQLTDEQKAKAVENLVKDIRAAGKYDFAVENNLVDAEAIKKARESLTQNQEVIAKTQGFNVNQYISAVKKKKTGGRVRKTRVRPSRSGRTIRFKAARTSKMKSAKTIKALL